MKLSSNFPRDSPIDGVIDILYDLRRLMSGLTPGPIVDTGLYED